MNFEAEIAKTITIPGMSAKDIEKILEAPKDEKRGDYALPCFFLAKQLAKNPAEIAGEIAKSFQAGPFVEKCEVAGGFLNFSLNRCAVSHAVLTEVLKQKEKYFYTQTGKGRVFACDFSSVNLAKHFHIGHLRNTILGETLCRLRERTGWTVKRLNYLGDYGTPFGLLIAGYKKWGLPKEPTVSDLQNLYVKCASEKEVNEAFANEGRIWFKKIEAGDKEALQIFNIFKTTTLKETEELYKMLGIQFDDYLGELHYSQFMPKIIQALQDKKLLKLSEGAQVIDLTSYDLGIAVVVSSQGASLYLTRDLAAAFERYQTYCFDQFVVLTATEQILNFKQLFQILRLMGANFVDKMEHVYYGRYSLEEGKLSSRLGAKALMKDVLAEGLEKAKKILTERNSDVSLAASIGYGSVVFSVLNASRGKDIVWNLDRALSFDGETGPYLQYTYARICSVLAKAPQKHMPLGENLTCAFEQFQIIKLLNNFKNILQKANDTYEPCEIARLLLNTAKAFNQFYNENRIISDDQDLTAQRIIFCKATQLMLAEGMQILGIDAIEKM